MRFISAFGEPEGHTHTQFTLPGYPKIYLLSNKKNEKGEAIGAHLDGIGWHTDYSYKEEPVMNTMLYALEVPPEGSDTLLADLCSAYKALPEARRKDIDPLVLHHSYLHFLETRQYGKKQITEKGLIQGQRFDRVGVPREDLADLLRGRDVLGEVGADEDRLRATPVSLRRRHGRPDAELARFVGCGGHDPATVRTAADDHRTAA